VANQFTYVRYEVRPQPRCPYYYRARPEQDFYLDEFLTPVAREIKKITDATPGDTLEAVGPRLFEVVRQVQYVTDQDGKGVPEYFKYPVETLKDKTGDCEDQSYLLASLLQGAGVPNVVIVFGTVEVDGRRFGHAWVEAQGKFIESTYPEYRPLGARPNFYHPEIAVSWGYAYQMGAPMGWQIGGPIGQNMGNPNGQQENQEVTRVLPQPSPEELEKLHRKLKELEERPETGARPTLWRLP